jgi:hypothetical protein
MEVICSSETSVDFQRNTELSEDSLTGWIKLSSVQGKLCGKEFYDLKWLEKAVTKQDFLFCLITYWTPLTTKQSLSDFYYIIGQRIFYRQNL